METRLPSSNGISIQDTLTRVKVSVSWPINAKNWSDLPVDVRSEVREKMKQISRLVDGNLK